MLQRVYTDPVFKARHGKVIFLILSIVVFPYPFEDKLKFKSHSRERDQI